MNPEKEKNFVMYSSEEEIAKKKAKTWTISVRINAEERKLIDEIKRILNLNMDGTALKIGARIGHNVLHTTFSAEVLKYLTSERRKREVLE